MKIQILFSRKAYLRIFFRLLGPREFFKATYQNLDHYQLLALPYQENGEFEGMQHTHRDQDDKENRMSIVERLNTEPTKDLSEIDETLHDHSSTSELHIGLSGMTESSLQESSDYSDYSSSLINDSSFSIPPLPRDYIDANLPVNIRVLHTEVLSISPESQRRSSWFQDKYIQVEILPQNHINLSDNKVLSDGLIIYLHGGGFVSMSSFSHEMYTRKWAIDTGENQIFLFIFFLIHFEMN